MATVRNLLILPPAPIAAVTARGTGASALLTADPKEVWTDSAVGSAATIDVDLGMVRRVNTVFLGFVYGASTGATWSITGGVADATSIVLKGADALAAPSRTATFPGAPMAFWSGAGFNLRYLRISVTQPNGSPLKAGVLLVGEAFVPGFNKDWGSGRRPIDLSNVTELPNGGYSVVEGARKRAYGWTLGNLSDAEVDRLDAIALDYGSSRPVLVVEDPAQTAGLRNRLHYGLFERWRQYDRRNSRQTRWELGIEEWL